MSEQDEGGSITRLGPESGGRGPGEPVVEYREWSWSADEPGRPGLPFLGIFLLGFGALLLLQQIVPGTSVWSWMGLLIGTSLLMTYATRRGSGSAFLLWVGVIFTAIGLPALLVSIGVLPERDGWGTLFLGIALIGLGLARRSRPGIPFSVLLGGILAIFGASQAALLPSLGGYVVPILVIGLGGILVLRAMTARSR